MSEEAVRPVLAADEEAFGEVAFASCAAQQNPCDAIASTHESQTGRDLRKCISLNINGSGLLACGRSGPQRCERAFGVV
jgi:hypothetical protein